MANTPREVESAIAALTAPRHKLVEAAGHVPNAAGLYAVYGSVETWLVLALDAPPDSRPLYVGKAERSLASRDLNTHFRTGCTEHSTVRRTFAALLRADLSLHAVPRNKDRPDDKPTHFGLEEAGDARLTEWMNDRLELAVWKRPTDFSDLAGIEAAVIHRWVPPLNIQGNAGSPWIARVRKARQVMADAVRESVRTRRDRLP